MSYDLALLALRVVVGGLMFGHGAQKLFGWFGGYGLAGTSAFFGSQLRLRPAKFWTLLAALSETGGGLLLALGLLNPLGALGIIAAMLMAIILAHWPRLWATEGGLEYPLVLLTVAAALALIGPGAFSIDSALGIALPEPATFAVGLALVLAGTLIALASREPVPAAEAVPSEAAPARAA